MKNNRKIIGIILLAVISNACIETFYPDIEGYENILVVDGMVTDERRPCQVRLSRTFSYEDNNNNPETGATVIIIDDQGLPFYLEEKNPGSYYTDTSAFIGRNRKPVPIAHHPGRWQGIPVGLCDDEKSSTC